VTLLGVNARRDYALDDLGYGGRLLSHLLETRVEKKKHRTIKGQMTVERIGNEVHGIHTRGIILMRNMGNYPYRAGTPGKKQQRRGINPGAKKKKRFLANSLKGLENGKKVRKGKILEGTGGNLGVGVGGGRTGQSSHFEVRGKREKHKNNR